MFCNKDGVTTSSLERLMFFREGLRKRTSLNHLAPELQVGDFLKKTLKETGHSEPESSRAPSGKFSSKNP